MPAQHVQARYRGTRFSCAAQIIPLPAQSWIARAGRSSQGPSGRQYGLTRRFAEKRWPNATWEPFGMEGDPGFREIAEANAIIAELLTYPHPDWVRIAALAERIRLGAEAKRDG